MRSSSYGTFRTASLYQKFAKTVVKRLACVKNQMIYGTNLAGYTKTSEFRLFAFRFSDLKVNTRACDGKSNHTEEMEAPVHQYDKINLGPDTWR